MRCWTYECGQHQAGHHLIPEGPRDSERSATALACRARIAAAWARRHPANGGRKRSFEANHPEGNPRTSWQAKAVYGGRESAKARRWTEADRGTRSGDHPIAGTGDGRKHGGRPDVAAEVE